MFAIFQFVEDFELARYKFTRLLCAFDRDFFLRFRVIGFEDVPFIGYDENDLPKLPLPITLIGCNFV